MIKTILIFILYIQMILTIKENFNLLRKGGYYQKMPNNFKSSHFGSNQCHDGVCLIKCNYTSSYKNIHMVTEIDLKLLSNNIIIINKNEFTFVANISHLELLSDYRNNLIVKFNESSINCSSIKQQNNTLICNATSNGANDYHIYLNATLSYGLSECRKSLYLGEFEVKFPRPNHIKWVILPSICLVVIIIATSLCIVKRNKRNVHRILKQKSKEQADQRAYYIDLQKRAFLEYQTAVDSFRHLGSLTPFHLNNFEKYLSYVLCVNFKVNLERPDVRLENILSNKAEFIEWVLYLETKLSMQQKNLIVPYISIVLFKNPAYCIEVLKLLLTKSIEELVKKKEEHLLFRKGTLVEKLLGNWLSICMYESLQNGEIGRRFFNLCRAIKCKIDLGPVDKVTERAKNCLSLENMILETMKYDTLNVVVTVNIEIRRNNVTIPIKLKNIDVDVLSIDTISQVKQKIIDRSLMVYSESGMEDGFEYENEREIDEMTYSLVLPTPASLLLYFVKDKVKLVLEDLDVTSIRNPYDAHFRNLNTMKHFNIKSGNNFLLTFEQHDKLIVTTPVCSTVESLKPMHLEIPESHSCSFSNNNDSFNFEKKTNKPNAPFSDHTKEAYLMVLLATKKSIFPFMEGFFQCLLNCRTRLDEAASSISLFEQLPSQNGGVRTALIPNSSQIHDNGETTHTSTNHSSYLLPIHYLFGLLEDIARDLNITDPKVINVWKCNSFILRFWVNIIKNPEFIFATFDKTVSFNDSLTTVAAALIESCSTRSSALIDMNSPVIKLLFWEEAKEKFPKWWNSFCERVTHVPDDVIINFMTDINTKFPLYKEYIQSQNKIKDFVDQHASETFPSMNSFIKCQNSYLSTQNKYPDLLKN